MAQGDSVFHVDPAVAMIWPTMGEASRHRGDDGAGLLVCGSLLWVNEADDATHLSLHFSYHEDGRWTKLRVLEDKLVASQFAAN